MSLPYDTKVVLPFDIATAQDMNERHANDVALANGTGLNDGAVTADKLDPTILAFGNYSTTEVDTGFKWIDGKSIYKRTLTGNITSAASAYNQTTLLAPGTIDKLIDSLGYIMSGSGQPISLMSWAGDNMSTWYLTSGVFVNSSGEVKLMSMSNSARTSQPYAITLLYTKV